MESQKGQSSVHIARFFLSLSILLAPAASASARASQRAWQPVVVEGAQLRRMLGIPVTSLEVLAWREGRLIPIPFQIDPAATDWTTASAPQCSPTAGNDARLRPADELAMMIADFGNAASGQLPMGALEIKIKDPLGGMDRYAYLASVKSPQRSSRSYVQFDSSAERVETDFYRFGMTNGWPSDFTYQDHRMEDRPSLIQQLSFSLFSRIFGFFPFSLTEHDLRISQPAVRCGPVRVILSYRYAIALVAGIRSPSITVPITFYRQYIISPVAVRFPWLPRLFFRDTRIRISADCDFAGPASLMWQQTAAAQSLREESIAGPKSIDLDPGPSVDWAALRQDGHLLIQAFKASRDLDLIQHNLFYQNSAKDRGIVHGTVKPVKIGYLISRLEELSAGKHVFETSIAVLDESSCPLAFLKELQEPPVVEVRPLDLGHFLPTGAEVKPDGPDRTQINFLY